MELETIEINFAFKWIEQQQDYEDICEMFTALRSITWLRQLYSNARFPEFFALHCNIVTYETYRHEH
jgi:hypothetical protein